MTHEANDIPPRPKGWAAVRARLFHTYFVLTRPMTLGARALVLNPVDNTVFLIRHTYVPGWQLPGGGVERNETFEAALRRELQEEGNIECIGPPELRSLHFNRQSSPRDHVAFYVVTSFRQSAPKLSDREIAEARFFPLDSLPDGTTPATLRRIEEVMSSKTPSPYW